MNSRFIRNLLLILCVFAVAFTLLVGCDDAVEPVGDENVSDNSENSESEETKEQTELGASVMITYESGTEASAGRAVLPTRGNEGGTVELSDCSFVNYGKIFAGWSDGTNVYPAGSEFVVPVGGANLTATWKDGGSVFVIDNCDSNEGWWGVSDIYNGTEDAKEGKGYNYSTHNETVIFCNVFDEPIDLSSFRSTGVIHMWLWIDNIDNVRTNSPELGLIELNDPDGFAYSMSVATAGLQTGWNEVALSFKDAFRKDGDLSNVVSFRLYQYVTAETTMRMDGFEAWMPEVACTVEFGGEYDYVLGMKDSMVMENVKETGDITLPESILVRRGHTFAGWSDGTNTYAAGDTYTVPEGGVNFTAVWTANEKKTITYDLGGESETYDSFAGDFVTLPTPAPRDGKVFASWSLDDVVYGGGTYYIMGDKDITFEAVWRDIDNADLLTDAVGAWELTEGEGDNIPSAIGGTSLVSKWAVWLNSDTFGRTADFSTEGSYLLAKDSGITLKDSFAISAWIKAPVREATDRVIVSSDSAVETEYVNESMVADADATRGWWSNHDITVGEGEAVQGKGYLQTTSNDVAIFCASLRNVDVSEYMEGGAIRLYLYVEDDSKLDIGSGGEIELSSDGGQTATAWRLPALVEGWNEIIISAEAQSRSEADMSKINYMRVFYYVSAETTLGIDGVSFLGTSKSGGDNSWKMYIDGESGALAFEADGLEGEVPSNANIVDGKWHHVMTSLEGGTLTYWVDGKSVSSVEVTGSISVQTDDIYIGNTASGEEWFDGSLAQVRIYDAAKTPAEVTATTIEASDNEAKDVRLKMNKGTLLERLGFRTVGRIGYEVYQEDFEYQTVDVTNIDAAKKFGFDYVKLTVTPNHLIGDDGALIVENMTYVTQDVNLILERGLPVLFCLHPEPDYKPTYLGNLNNFEIMIRWYGEFAAYIGQQWSPDEVSIQLMTEPHDNNSSVSWTWMSDRMWAAVRNELPDHTIITSSDAAGNIERLKLMSPATDDNLIYSFTTYEPYMVGFGTARSGMSGTVSFFNYLKGVPYPVPEGLTEEEISAMVEDITSLVPSEYKNGAVNTVRAYLRGQFDADPHYKNHYDTGYTAEWNMNRMNSLTDWSNKYGGNIHMMCVEFGCMDDVTAKKMFGAAEDSGAAEGARINLIHDLREAFEANGIGWSYWLFNGVFTVFDPETRIMDGVTNDAYIAEHYDPELIEYALGLTPDFSWEN